jgi:hypothetical protein
LVALCPAETGRGAEKNLVCPLLNLFFRKKKYFRVDIFVFSSMTGTSATRLIFIVPENVFKIGSGSEAFGKAMRRSIFASNSLGWL